MVFGEVLERDVRNNKKRLKNPTMTWKEIFDFYVSNGLKRIVKHLNQIIPSAEVIGDKA